MAVEAWSNNTDNWTTAKVMAFGVLAAAVVVGGVSYVTAPKQIQNATFLHVKQRAGEDDVRVIKGAVGMVVRTGATPEPKAGTAVVRIVVLRDGVRVVPGEQRQGNTPCVADECSWETTAPGEIMAVQRLTPGKRTNRSATFVVSLPGRDGPLSFPVTVGFSAEWSKNSGEVTVSDQKLTLSGEQRSVNEIPEVVRWLAAEEVSPDVWYTYTGRAQESLRLGNKLPSLTFALEAPGSLPNKTSLQAAQVTSSVSSLGGFGL